MKYVIGDSVCLKAPLTFLKTCDPMPMLRPPDLVALDEIGNVVGIRSSNILEVRFRKGTFLITIDQLVKNP